MLTETQIIQDRLANTPWHRCGTRIKNDESIAEAIQRAGLDSTLIACKTEVVFEDGSRISDPSRISWVRDKDKRIIARSGTAWKPLQNFDAIHAMDEWCRVGGVKMEVIGQINQGRTVFALANLGRSFGTKGDRSSLYGLLTTNHVVGMANTINEMQMRLICLNGATTTDTAQHYKQNHMQPFNLALAKTVVERMIDTVGDAEKNINKLKELKIDEQDAVDKILAPIWTPKHEVKSGAERKDLPRVLQEILYSYDNAPGAEPGTGYGIYNAVTHWTTHVAGRSDHTRLFRTWLGDYQRKVSSTERELLQLAD